MNVLFVCSRNRLRSPTAEAVFASHPGLTVLSAGTSRDAETRVSGDLVLWADVIVAMERTHRERLSTRYRTQLKGKRVVVLDIPDEYDLMAPELVVLLKQKVSWLLGVAEPE